MLNLDVIPQKKLEYQLEESLKYTSYFYTSIPMMIPKLWMRKLQKYKPIQLLGLRTRCKGYTTAILLEYEILYKKASQKELAEDYANIEVYDK